MNKLNLKKLLLTVFLTLSLSTIIAGEHTAKISKIIRIENTVEVIITSAKQFYVGSRPYALHIGNKVFSKSTQVDTDTESTLTFHIPLEDFNQLNNKAEAILVYGIDPVSVNTKKTEAKQFPGPIWELGIFNKGMLGQ